MKRKAETQPEELPEAPPVKKQKVEGNVEPQAIVVEEEEEVVADPSFLKFVDKTTFENSDQQLEHYLGIKPPRSYPFLLDNFQVESIWHLEQDRHVLVTAHTSAGKTVVAEYAIAKALEKNARVIYTSPIKALSNQKYREFQEQFGDVGLMTGDVYKNSNASVLVMTTEILRNMLYRGCELLQEVSYVVFDEVHYMRDASRGVVWEESIILLDPKIRMVFLSATLSNASDFAGWVEHTKKHPCHIVTTDFRPVPLKHYVYPVGGKGLFLVKDGENAFREDNFERAQNCSIGDRKVNAGRFKGNPNPQSMDAKKSDIGRLLILLQEDKQLPCIVFCFARLTVEGLALEVFQTNFSFVSEEETAMINTVYENAMETLTEEDRQLDVVKSMKAMLLSGIGCHHSGLLPILKEVTELLFQEGLVKVLFATETFAMGVNMPAKSVIFGMITKWDGKQERLLNASEYTQMSGRAGRRHKDTAGTCIMFLDGKINAEQASEMIAMKPAPLTSSFRLTYNMLLNLKQVDVTGVKEVIDSSFYRYLVRQQVADYESKLSTIETRLNKATSREDYQSEAKFFMLDSIVDEKLGNLLGDCKDVMFRLACPGRCVWVRVEQEEVLTFGWSVVVSVKKRYQPYGFIFDILTKIDKNSDPMQPVPGDDVGVIRVGIDCVTKISPIVLEPPVDLRKPEQQEQLWSDLEHIQKKMAKEWLDDNYELFDGLPSLDPLEHFALMCPRQVNPKDMQQVKDDVAKLRKQQEDPALAHIYHLPPSERASMKKIYREAEEATDELRNLKRLIKQSTINKFIKELRAKNSVLRHMGYVNKNGTLTKKACVACCLDSADEIVLTEMLFHDSFKDLSASEIPGFLSCFLDLRKPKGDPELTKNEKLRNAYTSLRVKVAEFIEIQKEYGVEVDEEAYMESFQPHLMQALCGWCEGKSFAETVKMCGMFEGQVVRNTKRVEDILRQMVDSSKAIGNSELTDRFKESLKLLRHGLAFSTSLYIGDEEEDEEYGYIPEQFLDEHLRNQAETFDDDEFDDEVEELLEAAAEEPTEQSEEPEQGVEEGEEENEGQQEEEAETENSGRKGLSLPPPIAAKGGRSAMGLPPPASAKDKEEIDMGELFGAVGI